MELKKKIAGVSDTTAACNSIVRDVINFDGLPCAEFESGGTDYLKINQRMLRKRETKQRIRDFMSNHRLTIDENLLEGFTAQTSALPTVAAQVDEIQKTIATNVGDSLGSMFDDLAVFVSKAIK
ncbi:MAG: hypothetical protein LBJ74_01765 [Heliobacteriaceae bacterium]|nr:hypothetical protein [Heliobacteriaceae bacterium]